MEYMPGNGVYEENGELFAGVCGIKEEDNENMTINIQPSVSVPINIKENDVVFGDGQIDSKSINRFVKNFPDSAIKFMFRKNLDGRNLPVEYEEIYINWEKRGLSRGRLKKYLFKLMKWDNFPDIPILEVVQRIKDRQYDLKGKK